VLASLQAPPTKNPAPIPILSLKKSDAAMLANGMEISMRFFNEQMPDQRRSMATCNTCNTTALAVAADKDAAWPTFGQAFRQTAEGVWCLVAGWWGSMLNIWLEDGPVPSSSFYRLPVVAAGVYLGNYLASQKDVAAAALSYTTPLSQHQRAFTGRIFGVVCDVPTSFSFSYLFWVLPFSQSATGRVCVGLLCVLIGFGMVGDEMVRLGRRLRSAAGTSRILPRAALIANNLFNLPTRILALALLHCIDEHIRATCGASMVFAGLELLLWSTGADSILFGAVLSPVSESLVSSTLYSVVKALILHLLPTNSLAYVFNFWQLCVSLLFFRSFSTASIMICSKA